MQCEQTAEKPLEIAERGRRRVVPGRQKVRWPIEAPPFAPSLGDGDVPDVLVDALDTGR